MRAFNLFAGAQYTSFEILRNDDGVRVFGSFQGGQWYEFAHSVALNLNLHKVRAQGMAQSQFIL